MDNDLTDEKKDQSDTFESDTLPQLSVKKCPNCGEVLTGAYCMSCGQKDSNLLRPFWNLMEDTLGDLFAFDSRFSSTVIPLLFKPGFMTRDYNQGKRARFVPPFRQYLVISVIFFLLLVTVDFQIFSTESFNINNGVPAAQNEKIITLDGIKKGEQKTPLESKSTTEEEKDKSFENILDDMSSAMTREREEKDDPSSELDREVLDTTIGAIGGLKKVWKDPKQLNIIMSDWIPTMMFFMLPIFAVILKVTYIRRKKFYIEHLVFSLHYHAFIFLLFSVMLLLYHFIPLSRDYLSYLFWYIPIYLFLALWIVYKQGPIKTFFKGVFISFIYFCLMNIALTIAVIYGLSKI